MVASDRRLHRLRNPHHSSKMEHASNDGLLLVHWLSGFHVFPLCHAHEKLMLHPDVEILARPRSVGVDNVKVEVTHELSDD